MFNVLPQLIMLSASANKLCKLKERAEEYASLIMEELDPENLGYIEVNPKKKKYSFKFVLILILILVLFFCGLFSYGSWKNYCYKGKRI